ncbi:MAG: S41 family peptidase, partial [Tissierellia bacterium]|nr:S41 family peptidase [Tissierellia bacterium]
ILLILFFLIRFISHAISGYKVYEYPKLRQNVEDDLTNNIKVSNTEGRSLTASEKIDDFNQLIGMIEKSFTPDERNFSNYKILISKKDEFRKRVSKTKTDDEFYDIIDEFLAILNDDDYKRIKKKRYDNLLKYYKDVDEENPWKEAIENPRAIDRYQRLIESENLDYDTNLELNLSENKKILVISIDDFLRENASSDKKKIDDFMKENKTIENVIIDLSNVSSGDNEYWVNVFSETFIKNKINLKNRVLYRSDINDEYLKYLSNKSLWHFTDYKKHLLDYNKNYKGINLNDYMYYDDMNIKFDGHNRDFNLYIIVNSNTKNAAETFACIMQVTNNASVVGQKSFGDALGISNTYHVLKHSGLIIELNTTKPVNYFGNIDSINPLNPNLTINSEDIVKTVEEKINNNSIDKEIDYFKNEDIIKSLDNDENIEVKEKNKR